jgi:hypothetical protein
VALDRAMLEMALRDDLLMTGTMATWQHKPDNYVGIASGAVFSLMSRNFAPRPVRLRSAIARENQIPAMFAQAEKNLISCDADTAAIAYDDAMGTVSFFTGDAVTAFAGAGDAATQAAFRHSSLTRPGRTRSARRTIRPACATKKASTCRSTSIWRSAWRRSNRRTTGWSRPRS